MFAPIFIQPLLPSPIHFPNSTQVTNLESLLINTAGSLAWRLEAHTEISNLFLASDYVRTYTDIACMEGANEAARRTTNAILQRTGSSAQPAAVWQLDGPAVFEPLRAWDRVRFRLGLPHAGFAARTVAVAP